MSVRLGPHALMASLSLAVAACAAAPMPAPDGTMRVLVKLVGADAEPAAIAAQAGHSSGHAARYLASAGSGWHALSLACADAQDCEDALRRLTDDRSHFGAVQRDGRKSIVSP
jgi:hypothetical protein